MEIYLMGAEGSDRAQELSSEVDSLLGFCLDDQVPGWTSRKKGRLMIYGGHPPYCWSHLVKLTYASHYICCLSFCNPCL